MSPAPVVVLAPHRSVLSCIAAARRRSLRGKRPREVTMKSLVRSAIATVCVTALCLAALCLATASRAGAQQLAVAIPPLRGHVHSPEGRPLVDAEVRVEGVKGSARSDVQGLFSLPNVTKGIQTI